MAFGIFFYFNNATSNKNNYEANRTSTSNEIEYNNNSTNNISTEEAQKETPEKQEVKQGIEESKDTPLPATEEQIATFSTKIYSTDKARQNNVNITCNTLNGTIVKSKETFSFCNTVGQATTSKGYQKAEIFDKYGNKKKGLGGRKLPN